MNYKVYEGVLKCVYISDFFILLRRMVLNWQWTWKYNVTTPGTGGQLLEVIRAQAHVLSKRHHSFNHILAASQQEALICLTLLSLDKKGK